jgi:hypothetical protein
LIPKFLPPLVGAGDRQPVKLLLGINSKKEKRAVGKKIGSNRPDLRFGAIYGYAPPQF